MRKLIAQVETTGGINKLRHDVTLAHFFENKSANIQNAILVLINVKEDRNGIAELSGNVETL